MDQADSIADVTITATQHLVSMPRFKHHYQIGHHAANLGIACSINRKNRVLRAPAANSRPLDGDLRHQSASDLRSVAGAGFEPAAFTL
ncbi:MAG TPA: hypothetical protein PK706_00755 [Xanthobacteraceae bacterium]|jgi:hypothetical protein|nr:hypothetical protein [Xanthobacteraceae bacterium]